MMGIGGHNRWLAAALALWTAVLCAVEPAAAEKLPIDEVSEEAFLALVDSGFALKRTAHFAIAYDTDEATLQDFVARVESTYRMATRFMKHHDIPLEPPPHRLEIYFFAEYASFHRYAERIGADARGAAGFYHPRSNRAAFYNAASAPRLVELHRLIAEAENALKSQAGGARQERLKELRRLRNERDRYIEAINQLVVQHEVAHQIFYNQGLHARGGDNPTWVVEGLACLFETPRGPYGAGMSAVNQYRLLNFREALTDEERARSAQPEDYVHAQRAGRLVSLKQLIGDKTLFNTRQHGVENNYAMAWSLIHFLQHRERDKLGEYLTVLALRPANRGYTPVQEVDLFEEVFGPLDQRFEQRWLEYTLSRRVRTQ